MYTDSKEDKAIKMVSLSVEDGKLVLEPVRQSKYTLKELLAGVDEVGEEVSWGKPQGKEAW